ncbi:hypothetical protein A2801_03590 [Candidatus Woesebacteria bacterium RIFCSPHIGHO2_01_FULL_41_10]|uniref:L,D-TPase catalytic domain-containing protein n=1 Tax=Candidatus Woesebacteria bacterium RIFCSPHIGHO2_01_FULL_41_10 TaxID=1802500 RepID=A0A1F7YNH4_9BACT|nr:MAG: hypothetical protein A2801_03590 [Candidatus Woesebacteria bacterium RIFCSPHIGHO2_01_FULL_41_10]
MSKAKLLHKRYLYFITPVVILGFFVFLSTTKKTTPHVACSTTDLSGLISPDLVAYYKGATIPIPSHVAEVDTQTKVLGLATPSERWIEVDLSDQTLKAWDGTSLFLETLISSGLPYYPTPTGEFRVWVKLRATRMEGGSGRTYYNLPNVPYVMYFGNNDVPGWRGYGIHGTYWHNDFGTPHSHGCVNVPTDIAEKLYYWATPILGEGKSSVFSDEDNPGIRVIIHE